MRLLFLIAALLFLSTAAYAQTAAPNFTGVPLSPAKAPPDEMSAALKIFDQLAPDTQKRLLNESKYAESYCRTNNMLSHFYDCSCFSLHLLAERLQRGPDIPFINLVGTAHYQQCTSTPAIAGYGYDRCLTVLAHMNASPQQLNAICACAGRTLATQFAANGAPDMNVANTQFDNAVGSCQEKNGF